MTTTLPPAEIGKAVAAAKALDFVEPDMKLGLGTGSTAAWFVKLLAKQVDETGLKITCCATSEATTALAESLGIKIHALDDLKTLDLAVDGADEFDPAFNLIKGAGGALLREKIVEAAAERFVVITDPSKEVAHLGAFKLPVEVVQFGWQTTARQVADVLAYQDVDSRAFQRRGGDDPYITDEGHFLLDLQLDRIGMPATLSRALLDIPGVVETGLFLDMATDVVVGKEDGSVKFRSNDEAVGGSWVDSFLDALTSGAGDHVLGRVLNDL